LIPRAVLEVALLSIFINFMIPSVTFRNMLYFYGELLPTAQPPSWRTPLFGCPLLITQYIRSYLPYHVVVTRNSSTKLPFIRAGRPRFNSRQGRSRNFFLFASASIPASGLSPPSLLFSGYRG